MLPIQVLKKWANHSFDFYELLMQMGVSDPQEGHTVYCPFHDDVGKKSAKIFKDALHCFTEAKQYRAYDILREMGLSDVEIESRLRATGEPPADVWVFSDPRVDLLSGLRDEKVKFMYGSSDIETYIRVAVTSMNSILAEAKDGT